MLPPLRTRGAQGFFLLKIRLHAAFFYAFGNFDFAFANKVDMRALLVLAKRELITRESHLMKKVGELSKRYSRPPCKVRQRLEEQHLIVKCDFLALLKHFLIVIFVNYRYENVRECFYCCCSWLVTY